MTASFTARPYLETVLDTVVETVTRLCRAEQGYMFRRRDDSYYMVATVGAGIEHLISPNWSIKGEYLYFDLGNSSLLVTTFAGAPIESGSFNRRNDGHIVRASINYHFGGPVIAKY